MPDSDPHRCPHCNQPLNQRPGDGPIGAAKHDESSPARNEAWAPVKIDTKDDLRDPRMTARGLLMRAAAVVALGMICAIFALAFNRRSTRPPQPIVARSIPRRPTVSNTKEDDGQATQPVVPRLDIQTAMDGIVVIRSNDAAGAASLGAGFVVDADGLVATNYHVISEATEARATFQNGASYEIEGYVAVRPEEDLAIVRLREAPELKPLPWLQEPDVQSLADVIAVGHPEGLDFSPSDGKVSRMIQTRQLPDRSRQFLRQIVSTSVNHLWIQHTAGISPGSSGGPLITPKGEVAGVNTWVDGQTQFGYALHIQHVKKLLQSPLAEIAPLDRYAKPTARVAALLRKLSGERIRMLFKDAEEMAWLPKSERQYETLQQLAWSVTVSSLPSTFSVSNALDTRLRELVTETDRVRRKLAVRKWNALGQITLINEMAAKSIHEPMAGVVVFAQVLRVVTGKQGSRGMLLQISGLEQTLFVPLDGQLEIPPVGANCLVLGVNYDGQVVRYGDNPLNLTVAPVVVSEMVLPMAE